MTTAMMSQKRKRDKAQEQLRSRMRQRRDGHGSSSTLLQARRRYTIRDGKGDTSLSGGMMNQSSSIAVTPGDLLSSNYLHWKPQPDQLNNSSSFDSQLSNVKGADPIPMQELIKRVLQRKVDNLELGSNILPIRNFKSRHVPYAVHHSSHVKKIVGTMSKHKTKGGTNKPVMPVVVVVDKEESNDGQHRSRSYPRLKNPLNLRRTLENIPPVQDDSQASVNSSKTASKTEPQTTSCRMLTNKTNHTSIGQSKAGDEALPNHLQQVTKAKQMTGTTCTQITLQHRESKKQSLNKRTMHKSKQLPAINSASSKKQNKSLTSCLIEDAVIKSKSRCSSGDDIINLKTAQSEAIQKLGELGEPTLLGTPRRLTHKMVRFKKDLGMVNRLSAIEEDIGITQVSKLSSLRETSSTSDSISRSTSLKVIVSNDSPILNKTVDVGG